MIAAEQLVFPFASLDFPGRAVLTVDEISERLGVTSQHVLDLVEENELPALDLAGKNATRRTVRVPAESYREFVLSRMTGPMRSEFMRQLPKATLRELRREIDQLLAA